MRTLYTFFFEQVDKVMDLSIQKDHGPEKPVILHSLYGQAL